MMILKYSYLNEDKTLVKTLKDGKYGIYNTETETVVAVPQFSYIYDFNLGETPGRITVIRDKKLFEVDYAGQEHRDRKGYEEKTFIKKGDYCPDCRNMGCATCKGWGCIPIRGDFSGGL